MGLFSWMKSKKKNSSAPVVKGNGEELKNAINKIAEVEGTEIYAVKNAQSMIDLVLEQLEKGEKDIQAIFDAVEIGKLTEDLLEDLTNELTKIEKARHVFLSGIEGVIETCEEAIRVETVIRFAAQHSNIEKEKLRTLRIIDISERKLLEDAKDMRRIAERIILNVSEMLELDTEVFMENPKIEADRLRKKKSAMDVNMLKMKNDLSEIDRIIKDVISASNTAFDLNLELGPALKKSVEFLEKGKTVSGGLERRKPNRITKELVYDQ